MSGCYLFRTDGTNRLGFGHVKRCLILAGALRERGEEVAFLLAQAEAAVEALIRDGGFRPFRLPPDAVFGGEAAFVAGLGLPGPLRLLIDFAHRDTLAERGRLPAYFRSLKDCSDKVVLFDGLGAEGIAAEADGHVDLVITPYSGGEEGETAQGLPRQAGGARFMIFDPAFDAYKGKPRPIASLARNLLITAGGADPTGIAAKALAAANSLPAPRLNIRLVVGPAFSRELVAELEGLAAGSPHGCHLIVAPANLARHMAWCDLAIATTGLTKYELALIGAPALLISLNRWHADNNTPFEAIGASRHLGVDEDLTTEEIAAALAELVEDRRARQDMSRRGLENFDGRGLERILAALDELD